MARPLQLIGGASATTRRGARRPRIARSGLTMACAVALALCVAAAFAQPPLGGGGLSGPRGGGPSGPGGLADAASTPRDAAPVDLTGFWASLVTEDWIERMSPDSPPSGDGGGFGFRGGAADGAGGGAAQAQAQAQAANPDDRCRVYGAGGSLRVPGRLHITWEDDDTLKIETSAGSQTRLLHFGAPPPERGAPSLQGYSAATWETGAAGRGGFGGPNRGQWAEDPAAAGGRPWGSLDVVTTNMTGGYLLSSRANYGPQAVLTEYFTHHQAFGDTYLTVTAIVEDGGARRTTSSTFKREPDGSKFAKSGCDVYR
jgi:hypothetical protein